MSSLSLAAAAVAEPRRVAFVDRGRDVTFAEAAARARAAAGWLATRGVTPGARVAVVAHNDLDTIALLFALFDLGAVPVLVHPRLVEAERAFVVGDCEPLLVVSDAAPEVDWRAEHAPAAAPPDDARPLVILYTSGTSGRPKGVVLARAAFVAAAAASAANLGWRHDDRWLLTTPIAHVSGLSVLLRCASARRTVVLGPTRFDAREVAGLVGRARVTLMSLVPTTLARLLDAGWTPPRHVRAVLLGGAASGARLLSRARAARVPALTTYGLTESCAQVTTQRYGTPPGPEQGAGPPLAGNEVKVAAGVVCVRGPTLLSGYFPPGTHPSPFDAEGWLVTGDLGRIDEEGRLHLDARRSDLIVSGGENVSPLEVERVLEESPEVEAACVFGVEDLAWGACVAAALVVRDREAFRPEQLTRDLATRLAPFKRPRSVALLDAFATTAAGKLDRLATKALAEAHLASLPYGPAVHR